MRTPTVLALSVWPALFGLSILSLTIFDPPPANGIIVFERVANCDVVIVRWNGRFYILDVGDSLVEVAGGQEVVGPLNRSGEQRFRIDGRATITARVQGVERDLLQAKARFDNSCGPDPVRSLLTTDAP